MKGMKEVLLTLFVVQVELSENQICKLNKEKISRGQTLKVIQKLKKEELINIQAGKRKAKLCSLSTKGLYYILFKYPNIFEQVPHALNRAFQIIFPKLPYNMPPKEVDGLSDIVKEAIICARKKVNLDFFDEQYAQWTYKECLAIALFRGIKNKKLSTTMLQRSLKTPVISYVKRNDVRKQILPVIKEVRKQLRKHIDFLKNQESMFKKATLLLENPSRTTR